MLFRQLGGMPLEGLDDGGSERVDVVDMPCWALAKFYLPIWDFCFLWMFGDA